MIITPYGELMEKTFSRPMFASLYLLHLPRMITIHWRMRQSSLASEVFIPLVFDPGEAFQFDWSYEWVEMAGMPVKVKVAHLRLCHSRHFLVVAYPRETQEMVFDAHHARL
jgi:hypothetical protein